MRSLLVTYDCEYDKPSTRLVMAAGIFPQMSLRTGAGTSAGTRFSAPSPWKQPQLLMRHSRTPDVLVFWRRPLLQRGQKHGCSLLVTPHGSRCKNSFHLSSAMGADGSTL